MKPARIISLVFGSLIGVVGFGLLAGGGVLGWELGTQRDDADYFTTSTEQFTTESSALTSGTVDLGDPGPNAFGDWANGTVRVEVDSARDSDVFVGIGRDADVEAFLADVPYDVITTAGEFSSASDTTYRREHSDGTSSARLPNESTIWVAQASGSGSQQIVWPVESGQWSIVVMNADASPIVTADVRVGGKVDHLLAIALGLGLGGAVLLAGGAALIVAGVAAPHARDRASSVGPAHSTATIPHPPLIADAHPLQLEAHLDPNVSRWQWLVKWILAIPHFIVLALLWVAFAVLTLVAFFAILATGRYPRSIFEFNVGVLRWTWRVTYYATSGLGTDRYPPFTLEAADYPATLDVAYPEHLSRGLVLVKSWLLALPQLVIVAVLTASWSFGSRGGAAGVVSGGLLGLLVLVAAVVLLFTGRYPERLHELIIGVNRWVYRVVVYVALMTDQYPPFHLDQGSSEPAHRIPTMSPA